MNNSTGVSNNSGSEEYEYPPLAYFAADFLEPSGIISVLVAAFGIIFNILNIIVLSHPKMRNSVNLLLTMLAASELALLIVYIPFVVIFNLEFDTDLPRFHTSNIHEARFMLFYKDASVLLHLSTAWLIITTACFRFIYVQVPLKSAQLCSYKRAIIAGATTVLASLVVSVPNIMLNTIQKYPCDEYPSEELCGGNVTFYLTIEDINTYGRQFGEVNFWLYATFGKFIPAILLLIFTIFLIRVLQEASRRKKRLHSDAGINRHLHSSAPTNEHAQTARMLLAVVILFFLIEFPHGCLLVYAVVRDDFGTYIYLGEVIDLATVTAFSTNLILYSAMSRQYRQLFFDIFLSKLGAKLRFTKFRAKYKKCSCSGTSHNAMCVPQRAELCALSVAQENHTVHSVLPSDESLNLIDGEQKHYVNNT